MAATFSQNNLAIQAGIDRATCKRILMGVEPDREATPGRPEYLLKTFLAAAVEHRLANSSNNDSALDGGAESSPLMQARVRITLANAAAKERENMVADGALVPKEASVKLVAGAFSIVREIILALPGKTSDKLTAHCSEDRAAIFTIIHNEVIETFAILSNPASYAEMPKVDESIAAAYPPAASDDDGGNGDE